MTLVRLKRGREKSLIRRHPWIFSGAIDRLQGPEPAAGESVTVTDAQGTPLAIAAWSPASQIRGRVWSFDCAEKIDRSFFRNRVEMAVKLRQTLGVMSPDGGCRLVFSEGDQLPGVVVDRYRDTLVLQIGSAGAERHRDEIISALLEVTGCRRLFERSDLPVRRQEGLEERVEQVYGSPLPPEEAAVTEEREQYRFDPVAGQKTGFYFDLRDARSLVRRFASGRRVLNCFSYTGAFAVAALRAGADSVINLDSSAPALKMIPENLALNAIDASKCENRCRDVFEELRLLASQGEKFDLVILDPPKLIRNASALTRGCRGYQDLARLGFGLLNPGGLLLNFSCSGLMEPALFQKITADASCDAGIANPRLITRVFQAADHPVALAVPETLYLKGLLTAI